jgi:hypothetical protein
MTTHYLKTWPEYFRSIKAGYKKAELRRNDRDYKVNDTLCLQEYDPDGGGYTNDRINVYVTHVLHGPGFGLQEGFVMMSIEPELQF